MSYQLPATPYVLSRWTEPNESKTQPLFTADQVLAAYLAGIEDSANKCRSVRHQGYVPPEDGSAATYYNDAAEECESAIRALAADGLVERKG